MPNYFFTQPVLKLKVSKKPSQIPSLSNKNRISNLKNIPNSNKRTTQIHSKTIPNKLKPNLNLNKTSTKITSTKFQSVEYKNVSKSVKITSKEKIDNKQVNTNCVNNGILDVKMAIYKRLDSSTEANCVLNRQILQQVEECCKNFEYTFHEQQDKSTDSRLEISEIWKSFTNKFASTLVLTFSCGKHFIKENYSFLQNVFNKFLNGVELSDKSILANFSFHSFLNNEIYNLLCPNEDSQLDDIDLSKLNRRKVFSIEHLLDLIQLGNLNYMNQKNDNAEAFVYHLEIMDSENNSRELFLIDVKLENVDQIVAKNHFTSNFEKCFRARQRNENIVPIDTNRIIKMVGNVLNSRNANVLILGVIFPSQNYLMQSLLLLQYIQRLKTYGTEEDNFGDLIIVKNQSVINKLKDTEEMNLYLYLLNNVSILEKDLLDAHKHFNEVMNSWTEDHNWLEKMASDEQVYDVDNYTSKLMNLLTDQSSRIASLIKSVDKFRVGLAQLKQSVDDEQNARQTIS